MRGEAYHTAEGFSSMDSQGLENLASVYPLPDSLTWIYIFSASPLLMIIA